jgi:hypothetical protein
MMRSAVSGASILRTRALRPSLRFFCALCAVWIARGAYFETSGSDRSDDSGACRAAVP